MFRALCIASIVALSACSSTPGESETKRGLAKFEGDKRLGTVADRICFASSIDSFQDETRDTVVLREGGDFFLVEIFGSCFALDHAQQIGIDSTGGCLTKGDRLVVSDSISGFGDDHSGRVDRCSIKSIHTWDPKAENPA